jgi:hypothetical protein
MRVIYFKKLDKKHTPNLLKNHRLTFVNNIYYVNNIYNIYGIMVFICL